MPVRWLASTLSRPSCVAAAPPPKVTADSGALQGERGVANKRAIHCPPPAGLKVKGQSVWCSPEEKAERGPGGCRVHGRARRLWNAGWVRAQHKLFWAVECVAQFHWGVRMCVSLFELQLHWQKSASRLQDFFCLYTFDYNCYHIAFTEEALLITVMPNF